MGSLPLRRALAHPLCVAVVPFPALLLRLFLLLSPLYPGPGPLPVFAFSAQCIGMLRAVIPLSFPLPPLPLLFLLSPIRTNQFQLGGVPFPSVGKPAILILLGVWDGK